MFDFHGGVKTPRMNGPFRIGAHFVTSNAKLAAPETGAVAFETGAAADVRQADSGEGSDSKTAETEEDVA